MKISRNWLSDFITWKENDSLKIADALTKGMGEVDNVELQGQFLEHCVVGKITKLSKHPNADKLSLVDVQTDRGTKHVVCGGTNLREGMLVAFAHIGAHVKWHGGDVMELQPVKIRGEASEGMICAAEELELPFASTPKDGERPILDLSSMNLKIGASLKSALKMNDVVFHIDNHAITNRPDLFSHIGVARECVALGLATWKKTKPTKRPAFPKIALPFKVTSRISKLIPRYLACTISFDDMPETPQWMKERLAACGCRSINLPIDITNYVQYEHGMPLHSFDPADFRGNITMRTAEEGEKITTLDGVERVLPEGAVVISDDEGIFDLLGIMGGLRSSTKDSTRTIFLHSAIVNGASIRKAIIQTGHRTDAATVYEKDIAPITCEQGFYRALELFLTLLPGATITSKLETWGANGKPKTINIEQSFIHRMIGQDIPSKKIIQILKDLGCTVTGTKKLSIKPPLWRAHDLTQPADIVEEIARVIGYNTINADMPAASLEPPMRDHRISRLRSSLKEDGWMEFVNLAFSSPELLTKTGFDPAQCIAIQNPLGEELSLMHPSLLPSLLDILSRELPSSSNTLRGFEMGNVFEAGSPERLELTLVLASKNEPGLLDHPFLLLKQDLLRALNAAGHHAELQQMKKGDAQLHPGQMADVLLGKTRIGSIGTLHPSIQAAFGFTHPVCIATLNVDLLLKQEPATKITTTVPPFPAISYDETIALKKKSAMSDLLKKVRAVDALLEGVQAVDLYKKGSDERITLRFTYRAPDRTLTESDVSPIHGTIVALLKNA